MSLCQLNGKLEDKNIPTYFLSLIKSKVKVVIVVIALRYFYFSKLKILKKTSKFSRMLNNLQKDIYKYIIQIFI
ncbi:MAG: hypothetical protein HAW60_00455 [Bdellovibrionales bacterium]|nr:hypothetical protein [Bdellovibrionales bacterium]